MRGRGLGIVYSVVGVSIKTEIVLSPNDEEVANSSKKTYAIQH